MTQSLSARNDAPVSSLGLAYLVVQARRPAAWHAFCDRMLALPAPLRNGDGSSGWRIDAAMQRLIVREGPADDLEAFGLEFEDEQQLEERVFRLRRQGFEPVAADSALESARRVRRLYQLRDPAGNTVELVAGLARTDQPFASPEFPGGFVTGRLGMGHLALVAHDLPAMERFYVDALGFRVTERLQSRSGPLDIRGTFLHCNSRHHTLALFSIPVSKRVHHVMFQAAQWGAVGRAFERARAVGVPLSLTLGQHPDPDGTFSFYGATPSGFDFEIGAGSGEIVPATWQEARADKTSSWGHEPQLRLKARMAWALLAHRFGGRRRSSGAAPAGTGR